MTLQATQSAPISASSTTLLCAAIFGAAVSGVAADPGASQAPDNLLFKATPSISLISRRLHPETLVTNDGPPYIRLEHESVFFLVRTAPRAAATITLASTNTFPLNLRVTAGDQLLGQTNCLGNNASLSCTLMNGTAAVTVSTIPQRVLIPGAELFVGSIKSSAAYRDNVLPFTLQVSAEPEQPAVKESFPQRLPLSSEIPLSGGSLPSRPSAPGISVPSAPPVDRFGNRYYDGGRIILGPNVQTGSISVDSTSRAIIGGVRIE